MTFIKQQIGVTLLELTVVLLILVALAGLAIPYLGGTSSTALCNATDVTMQNVKKAIMERYYLDTLGQFPQDLSGLTPNPTPDYNLHYLFSNTNVALNRTTTLFDPQTQVGWHGPYLQGGTTLNSAGNLSTTFTNTTGGFVNSPLINGDTVVLDGWGRPLVLQVPDSTHCSTIMNISSSSPAPAIDYCARLVSAGVGIGLAIGGAAIDTPITGNKTNDDRILYLNAPTPANDVNPPCNSN